MNRKEIVVCSPTGSGAVCSWLEWEGFEVIELRAGLKAHTDAILLANRRIRQALVLVSDGVVPLRRFLRMFPARGEFRVVLRENPSVFGPGQHPLIIWLDYEIRGSTVQSLPIEPRQFVEAVNRLRPLARKGRQFIDGVDVAEGRRACMPFDEVDEIVWREITADPRHEVVVTDLRDLDADYSKQDTSWQKKTFRDLVRRVLEPIPQKRRLEVLNVILDYQLGHYKHRRKLNAMIRDTTSVSSPDTAKYAAFVGKWMDNRFLGKPLYDLYLDLLANRHRRSFETMLAGSKYRDEIDLELLLARQPLTKASLALYRGSAELVLQADKESDDVAPTPLDMTTRSYAEILELPV